MNKWLVLAAAISLTTSAATTMAAGDVAAGKAKSATCAGCHGMDGNSVNPEWPNLAGQHANYITKQLADFKAGKDRNNATMSGMVAALSPQDMTNLGAYFASLPRKQSVVTDKTLAEAGQKLYRGGDPATGVAACIGCHGPTGAGNPAANFPALSGQHAKYVENQLNAFKTGERKNDAGKMMRSIAGKMSAQEIKAVAAYVQGLY